LVFQQLRVYTQSSPSEPFHFLFRPRILARKSCSGLLAAPATSLIWW